MVSRRSTFITNDESEFIRFQLSFAREEREVKAGLQRLCAHYDVGHRLPDPHEHRLLVHGLLIDQRVIIRRWAYKAIARLGTREDAVHLISHLNMEPDIENQTWAMTAIIALARDIDVPEVCEEAGLDMTLPLTLAGQLFADERLQRSSGGAAQIDIDQADSLTLKWAALLSGYGRAPDNLFHPRIENRVLLGKLNEHPESEVSEYSVWALWQYPAYRTQDLGIRLDAIAGRPENVRRWINRLITKDPELLPNDPDLFDELRHDVGARAREGLALGLREIYAPGLERRVLDWHDVETEGIVRELLLEHMAFNAGQNPDFADVAERRFGEAGQASGIRKRLLAACSGKPLYSVFRRIQATEVASGAGLFDTGPDPQLVIVGEVNVKKTSINAGRDINAQNIVGGDMIDSANAAIQNMDASRLSEQATLTEIVRFLERASDVDLEHKSDATKSVVAVAKDESPRSKKGLIKSLENIANATGAIASTAEQAGKFIDTVSGWL